MSQNTTTQNGKEQNLTKEEQKAQEEALFAKRVQEFQGSRLKLYFVLLRSRLVLLAKVNLILAFFALPAIAVVIIFNMMRDNILGRQPFSANIGLGILPYLNAGYSAALPLFMQSFWGIVGVTAGIPIFLIGLCGAMYTMKFVARGQNVKVLSTFAVGIKKCFLPFLVIAPIFSGLFFVLAGGIAGFEFVMVGQNAAKIAILVITGVVALIVLFMLFFYSTMGVTYKMNPWQIFVNAIKITFMPKLIWRHLIIAVITVGPLIGVAFLPGIGLMIGLFVVALIVISLLMLMWTIYADWVYKRVYAPTIAKRTTQEKEQEKQAKAENKKTTNLDVSFSADGGDTTVDTSNRPTATEVKEEEIQEVGDSETEDSEEIEDGGEDGGEEETPDPTPKTDDFEDLGELEQEETQEEEKSKQPPTKKSPLKVKNKK